MQKLKECLGSLAAKWTPERISHDSKDPLQKYLLIDHLARYKFAEQFASNRNVLDIACGTGYGSNILARSAKNVVGVDISPQAITQAENSFRKGNLRFICTDAIKFLQETSELDVVCSFETIEHLQNYQEFIDVIAAKLKPGGIFIISSPNREFGEVILGGPVSSYHLREFYTDELQEILQKAFGNKPRIFRQRMFFRKNKTLSAWLSFMKLRSKIEIDKPDVCSITDIFVVIKE